MSDLPYNFNPKHYLNLHYKRLGYMYVDRLWYKIKVENDTTGLENERKPVNISNQELVNHYLTIGKKQNYIVNYRQVRVIVYSGGKTGSTTLYNSFEKIFPIGAVIHTHNNRNKPYNLNEIIKLKREPNKKIFIVSSYREPISRNISSFFHNITDHLKLNLEEINNLPINSLIKLFTNMLNKKFFENYHPHLPNDIDGIDNIDIFSQNPQFDHEQGYQIYNGSNSILIMLKFSDIDKWENILKTYIRPNFTLLPSNLTECKEIAPIYKKFKHHLRLPKCLIDKIFNTDLKNLKYFLSEQQFQELKFFWYTKLI